MPERHTNGVCHTNFANLAPMAALVSCSRHIAHIICRKWTCTADSWRAMAATRTCWATSHCIVPSHLIVKSSRLTGKTVLTMTN